MSELEKAANYWGVGEMKIQITTLEKTVTTLKEQLAASEASREIGKEYIRALLAICWDKKVPEAQIILEYLAEPPGLAFQHSAPAHDP